MKSMKLLDFYKAILTLCKMEADDNGFVSIKFGTASAPVTVDGKRMVLPTPERQKAGGEVEFFHPLGEHAYRPETKVLTTFRKAVLARLNLAIGTLCETLLTIAASEADHKKFNPTQLELLKAIPDANEKALANFKALKKAMGLGNPDKCFVNIYLRSKGKVKDKQYRRVAITTFPLYEELSKNDKKVYDVTLAPKERRTIMALLSFIFEKIAQPEAYNSGSDSSIAPYLEAFLQTVAELGVEDINPKIVDFANFNELLSEVQFEDEWLTPFKSLHAFSKEIDMLPLYGDAPEAEKKEPKENEVRSYASAQKAQEVIRSPEPTGTVVVDGEVKDDYDAKMRKKSQERSRSSSSWDDDGWGASRSTNGWGLSSSDTSWSLNESARQGSGWGREREREGINPGVLAREQPPVWEQRQVDKW